MKRYVTRMNTTLILIALALVIGFLSGTLPHNYGTTHAAGPLFKRYVDFVNYIRAHHKAPFMMPAALSLKEGTPSSSNGNKQRSASSLTRPGTNVKVNQDRNPWAKAGLAAAVDPITGRDYVIMANDFREFVDHQFYHSSINGGVTWHDDAMTDGTDPITFEEHYNFQSDPGVAFDRFGNSFISNVSGNMIFDDVNGYFNTDTEIDVVTGHARGTYTDNLPIRIDFQRCDGLSTEAHCPVSLDKPLITVDNVPGSPHEGSIYVYYTLFCNAGPCTDGGITFPDWSSAILESHAAGVGQPFSNPELVSGPFTQAQFSDMVIDSHGTPHIFFDDFSNSPAFNIYESTLSDTGWIVNTTPVASFISNGELNDNWNFDTLGSLAPGCSIHIDTAYCAFYADQIVGGPLSSTPDIYLVRVNTLTAAAAISRVNNDPSNAGKFHFFPWASAARNGAVYVGWYDDHNDPSGINVQYFVAKSTNQGVTFPIQRAVSDFAFNPCIGTIACQYFGDYTQLVTGPDSVTHAAWSDTRDGVSMQIYSQPIRW